MTDVTNLMRDARLAWIHKNRSKGTRVRSAGDIVRVLVDDIRDKAVIPAVAAAQAVAMVVDAEFTEHCRVAGVRGGTLIIHVDQSALVSAFRRRWHEALSSALRGVRGHGAFRRIDFRVGTGGVSIPRIETT